MWSTALVLFAKLALGRPADQTGPVADKLLAFGSRVIDPKAEDVTGLARGVAFQLVEALGVIERHRVAEELKGLDQEARASLRKYGVRFGAYHVYLPALLKPAPRALAVQLWALKRSDGETKGLDDVRALWDIDNDRTWLLSESAGTSAGLQLGLVLRQSYFAAFWANDVNATAGPAQSATELGFAPWGNAGPGGAYAEANAIVADMRDAGYRIDEPAPYDGPGAGEHGSITQLDAAVGWFSGRSRQ